MLSPRELEQVIHFLSGAGINLPPDVTPRYLGEELLELARRAGTGQAEERAITLSTLGSMRRRMKGKVTAADAAWVAQRARRVSR